MKTKRELAEARIDKMGFDETDKKLIFYDWPEGEEHYEWLLTASEREINSWFDAVQSQSEG
mgnify:CR=1 FL=1